MSLKKYVTKRTDKLLPYSELCEHALGYIMLEEVYIVQVVFCEAHRAVIMPISPFVCTQHLQEATCVIQLHTAKCVT